MYMFTFRLFMYQAMVVENLNLLLVLESYSVISLVNQLIRFELSYIRYLFKNRTKSFRLLPILQIINFVKVNTI